MKNKKPGSAAGARKITASVESDFPTPTVNDSPPLKKPNATVAAVIALLAERWPQTFSSPQAAIKSWNFPRHHRGHRRRGYGIEIDAHYTDAIIHRFDEVCGLKAVHAESKLNFEDLKNERSEEK